MAAVMDGPAFKIICNHGIARELDQVQVSIVGDAERHELVWACSSVLTQALENEVTTSV